MRQHIIRPGTQRRLEIRDGLGKLLPPGQDAPDVVQRIRIARLHFHRLAVVRQRLVRAPLTVQPPAQVVGGYKIVAADRQGMAVKALAAAPATTLVARPQHTPQQHERRQANQHRFKPPPPPRFPPSRLVNAPDHYDENAHHWQVGVAIGQGLLAHLHQPNHRHQHAQKPEPAGHPKRMPPPLPKHQSRHARQQNQSQQNQPQRPMPRMRIRRRQVQRPKSFPQVTRIRHQRIAHPRPQRQVRQRLHRRPLRHHRRRARSRRQGKEGQLFQEKPGKPAGGRKRMRREVRRRRRRLGLPAGPVFRRPAAFAPPPPPQRPIIQQQQHEGHRHQHRLAHQPQGKETQGEKIAT